MPIKINLTDLIDGDKGGRVRDKNYVLPELDKDAFHCPHPDCGAYAHQHWCFLGYAGDYDSIDEWHDFSDQRREIDARTTGYAGPAVTVNKGKGVIKISTCSRCKHASLWRDKGMVYPNLSTAPPPNDDLPENALVNYKEAASVFSLSPCAAAAMLRLAVQDICVFMGGEGKNMQSDIDYLIEKKGLPRRLIEAMDAVRIVGNKAVHPGKMNSEDDAQTVGILFGLVNRIAEKLIAEPRVDKAFYDSLPDSQKRKKMPSE